MIVRYINVHLLLLLLLSLNQVVDGCVFKQTWEFDIQGRGGNRASTESCRVRQALVAKWSGHSVTHEGLVSRDAAAEGDVTVSLLRCWVLYLLPF